MLRLLVSQRVETEWPMSDVCPKWGIYHPLQGSENTMEVGVERMEEPEEPKDGEDAVRRCADMA